MLGGLKQDGEGYEMDTRRLTSTLKGSFPRFGWLFRFTEQVSTSTFRLSGKGSCMKINDNANTDCQNDKTALPNKRTNIIPKPTAI
jgi:hypothetical protein